MSSLKSLFAAIAFAVTTPLALALALAPAAAAQGTNVVVIDRIQIVAQSKAGQDIRNKIQSIEASMQAELKPAADKLQADGAAIETKTQGMTPEAMRADAALRTEVEAYARQANEFNVSRQVASQELALTERQALAEFNNALIPILREVVSERGANVILDKSSVVFVDEATDVTATVIAKLDVASPVIAVVRQKLPPQNPQQ